METRVCKIFCLSRQTERASLTARSFPNEITRVWHIPLGWATARREKTKRIIPIETANDQSWSVTNPPSRAMKSTHDTRRGEVTDAEHAIQQNNCKCTKNIFVGRSMKQGQEDWLCTGEGNKPPHLSPGGKSDSGASAPTTHQLSTSKPGVERKNCLQAVLRICIHVTTTHTLVSRLASSIHE